jgi:hypothetical protein
MLEGRKSISFSSVRLEKINHEKIDGNNPGASTSLSHLLASTALSRISTALSRLHVPIKPWFGALALLRQPSKKRHPSQAIA